MEEISFTCPECGKNLTAPPEKAGASIRCPDCGTQVQIPEPEAQEPEWLGTPLALEEPEEAPAPPPREARARPRPEVRRAGPARAAVSRPETCGLATASLVLGIVGLFCLGPLAGIPAIVCGHIAHGRVRRSAGQLGGAGLAVAGFVLGYVSFVSALVLGVVLMPALSMRGLQAEIYSDANNLKQIGSAILTYSAVFDERMPASLDDLCPHYVGERQVFVSPADSQPQTTKGGMPCSYEYVGSLRVAPLWSAESIIAYTRKGIFEAGRNCLFLDGHVTWTGESEIAAAFAASYEEVKRGGGLSPQRDKEIRAFYELAD